MDDFDGEGAEAEAETVADFDGEAAEAEAGEMTSEQAVLGELFGEFVESGQLSPEAFDALLGRDTSEEDAGYDQLWEIDYEAPDDGDGYV